MSKKIGIFAGTFDPIHNGHLAFAEAALQRGLEKVWFLVEPKPRRKQGVHALEHRQAMVDLAIADNPKFGTIITEQPRFTAHQTLPLLQSRFLGHKIVLLFGNDVVAHMADWPHVDELVKSVELFIASRESDNNKILHNMKYLEKSRNIKFDYQIIRANQSEISSSRLRTALRKGKAIAGVPAEAQNYILQNKLYSSVTDSASS